MATGGERVCGGTSRTARTRVPDIEDIRTKGPGHSGRGSGHSDRRPGHGDEGTRTFGHEGQEIRTEGKDIPTRGLGHSGAEAAAERHPVGRSGRCGN